MPLNIEGGDGEKTLGEAEKTFICWHKRFIIILGVSLPPPSRPTDDQDPQHRCMDSKTIFFANILYILNSKIEFITHNTHCFLSRHFSPILYSPVHHSAAKIVDIWERNKELIRKRTDIGEHFTLDVFQSIVFIFLPLGERVHLTNPVYYY